MKVFHSDELNYDFGLPRATVSGQSVLTPLTDYGVAAADNVCIVEFDSQSRTHWHVHDQGQILVILDGSGEIAVKGQDPVAIRAGDVVLAEPGEMHWHGAVAGAQMRHLAVSRGPVTWHDEVEV